MRSLKTHLSVLSVAVLLAACGGGGGGSDTAATSAVTPSTTQTPATTAADTAIQTQVLSATYAGTTEQRNAYDYLNAQRQLCGFGLLQQDAKLDVTAQGHANYLSVNHVLSHYQDSVAYPNGFTGTTLNDRFIAAGYVATSGTEVLTEPYPNTFYGSYGSSYGQSGVMDLFAAPYHGNGMLYGERDLGIGFGVTDTSWRRLVINIGSTATRPKQQIATDKVLTYPCAGTTGLLSKTYTDEIPSPIPGRNLVSNPIGHPIYVKVRDGNTLALSNYVLRKAGTNVDLALQLLNKASDTTGTITDTGTAILMPLAPLDKNTSYLFTAAGTNNGVAISVSFTFNTGAY